MKKFPYLKLLFAFILDLCGSLISTAWNIINLLSGLWRYMFKWGWVLGIKYKYACGSPNTPFNMPASHLNYPLTGGVSDYSRLKTLRPTSIQQVDICMDKKMDFRKMYLDVFFDMLNGFLISNESYPFCAFERADGNSVKADETNSIPVILNNSSATVLPTFGGIIEF